MLSLFKIKFKEIIANKLELISLILIIIVNTTLFPIAINFIYNYTTIAGWSFEDYLFLQGYFNMLLGIIFFLTGNLYSEVERLVRSRELDLILSYPMNELKKIIADSISFPDLCWEIIGIIFILLSHRSFNFILLPFFLSLSSLFAISVNILLCSIIVVIKRSPYSLTNLFHTFMFAFSDYPLTIYPSFLKFIFSYVIPIGILTYFPSSFLLGKLFSLPLLIYLTLFTITLFLFSLFSWKKAIAKYMQGNI